jgi:flagellar basal body-associated protein FliL
MNKRTVWLLIILGIVIISAGAVGGYYYYTTKDEPVTKIEPKVKVNVEPSIENIPSEGGTLPSDIVPLPPLPE